MGLIKQAVIVGLTIVIYSNISKYLEEPLPVNFGGTWEPDFQSVVDIFRENVNSGNEPGAAFAVYFKGKPVIDVWGGYADKDSRRPWEKDTTSLVFSCTKGVAAILLAKMVEENLLDYSKPVSHYWPEFAENDKGNITVEMLISHQGGLAALDEQVSILDYKNNREKWSKILASQKTAWPAGRQFGYHALTFGLYVDELIERADPKKRDTATLFQELIADPHGIDFFMNSPIEHFHRTARLVPRSKFQLLMDALQYRRYLTPIFQVVFDPESLMARSVSPIKEFDKRTDVLNNPYYREVTVSSLSGTGTARGLARLYGIMVNGGQDGGKTLLSRETIERLATPVVTGMDSVMLTGEQSVIGLGTLYRKNPKGERTVGHTGHGAQVAIGDHENGLGIAYITNHLTIHGIGDDPRYQVLEQELYRVIEKLNK